MKYAFDSSTLTYFIEKLKEKFSLKTEVTEQINELEKIESSEIEPTNEMVSLWINTSEETSTNVIARINDDTVASNTTWSSEKINASITSGGSNGGGNVDLSDYALKTDLHNHNNKSVLDNITSTKVSEWNNKSTFSGNYNDLTNKPTIPTVPTNISSFTNDSGYITSIPSEYITDSELTAKGYATENYVTTAIDNAQLSGGSGETVDMTKYALKTELPTKTSQLTNDSNFLTSIPSEYVTETELNNKGYLTEHQSLENYAKTSDLHTHDNKSILDNITSDKVTEWNNKSTFSGSYNDLTDKPTIPTDYITEIPSEYITETELNAKGYLTEHQDISGKADKTELHEHTNKTVLDTITSDMTTKWNQSIPFNDTYVSDCNAWLTNGYVKTGAGQTSNLPSACTGSDRGGILFFVAENVTQGTGTQMYFPIDGTYKGRIFTRSLTNMKAAGSSVGDWNLLATTNSITEILSEYITETELISKDYATKNYVTETINSASMSGGYTHPETHPSTMITGLSTVATSGSYNDLTNKPTIPTVPTNISSFTNDSGYITSIPSEYITETELNAKGYLTVHQSLDGYAKTSDLHSHSNKSVLDNITSAKVTEWNNKSTFSGSYNDLTDKPTIPTVTNDLTNTLKSNYDTAYTHSQSTHAPSNAQKNSDITKTEIEAKLTGDIASHTHSQYLTEHQSLENYALKSEIPTNYLTSIPSEYVTETELTAKGYALKSEIPTDYITEIPSEYITETELNNKGYITSIPSEYITETELTAKGYATTSQIPTSLPANGGNADTVNGFSIWSGTQVQYDALGTKSDTTIYLIKEG